MGKRYTGPKVRILRKGVSTYLSQNGGVRGEKALDLGLVGFSNWNKKQWLLYLRDHLHNVVTELAVHAFKLAPVYGEVLEGLEGVFETVQTDVNKTAEHSESKSERDGDELSTRN